MSTGPAALPLVRLTPPPPPLPVLFSRFLNPRGPDYLGAWNRLRKIINTDLADTPFPFPFRAFLLLPHFCLALLRLPRRLNFFGCSNLLIVNLHLNT